jgi:hypothetical protein
MHGDNALIRSSTRKMMNQELKMFFSRKVRRHRLYQKVSTEQQRIRNNLPFQHGPHHLNSHGLNLAGYLRTKNRISMEPNEQLQQAMTLRWDQRKQEKAQSILGHPPKDQDKTINARFQEIDSIMKNQQNLWELWVRKRRVSLLTIFDRGQFYRTIDDLDQKMAAVQLSLENNNLLMVSNQRKISKRNRQEMLMDTAEQLDEV